MLRYGVIFTILYLFVPKTSYCQLTINSSVTAQTLAKAIVGKGAVVTNATLNCPNGACGTFTANNTNLGLNSGILLTSGDADKAIGPNNSGGAGKDNNGNGDADLKAIIGGNTFDACILEFDIIPSCDTLKINYVFASEEYNEYVCANVNDVFAFFISGPGITGTQNIATVPNTTTAVAINSVNNGSVGSNGNNSNCTSLANSAYFVDNKNGNTIEYDGFTIPMIAKSPVQSCQTYHMKIAIADGGDGVYDSGVFLDKAGLTCDSDYAYITMIDSVGVEGCKDLSFEIHRTGDLASSYTVDLITSGTATDGIDYTGVPTSYTFSPGETTKLISISVANDGITEGTETLLITGQYLVCGYQFTDTLSFTISDAFTMTAGTDTSLCSGGGQINLSANYQGAIKYKWTPTAGLSNANISNPVATVNTSTVYYVTATDANGCIAQDSVTITIGANLGLTTTYNDVSCNGGNDGQASVAASAGNNPFTYLWNDPNAQTTAIATNLVAGVYQVTVTDATGCSDDTTVSINEAEPIMISVSPNDSICVGASATIIASATGGILPYTYTWDNGLASSASNTVSPVSNTTYTVFVTDANNCVSTDTSVTIYLASPLNISLSLDPAAIVCPGESIVVTANVSGGVAPYFYNWNNGGFFLPDSTYSITPNTQTMIYVEASDNCNSPSVMDSVSVGIFPLPLIDVLYPDNDGCAPLTVNFFDNTTPTALSYSWVFGDINSGANNTSSIQNPSHTFTNPGTYSIDLTIVTNDGCLDSMPFTNIINVYSNPVADFTFSPESGTLFEPNINFINASIGASIWQWNFGDSTSATNQNPSHIYEDTGFFKVSLFVVSTDGCVDSTYKYVEIKGQYAFYAPSAFTPNGDGINDSFMPKMYGIDKTNFAMYIFDRWGDQIYETEDVTKPWDGKKQDASHLVPEDVYIWKVKNLDIFGEHHSYIGKVSMLK